MKTFLFFKLTSRFEAFFYEANLLTTKPHVDGKLNKRFLRFHGHKTDYLIGFLLTNNNPGHKLRFPANIFHFRCANSCVITRFSMAVDFSCLQKELLGYVPLGFTHTRNFVVEKVRSIPPLVCQPNISSTQGKFPSFE